MNESVGEDAIIAKLTKATGSDCLNQEDVFVVKGEMRPIRMMKMPSPFDGYFWYAGTLYVADRVVPEGLLVRECLPETRVSLFSNKVFISKLCKALAEA